MYGIGSVSKIYTTAAVMKLVDEDKLDLDIPLVNYIPDFKMEYNENDKDKDYRKITPRMLLNHSSGLMGSCYNNSSLLNDNDTKVHDNFLSILSHERLKAVPGEFSVYCNDGFSLAEILVERLSGMSFTEYISKNFSKPLELKNTNTPLGEFDRNQLAKTYVLGISNDNEKDKDKPDLNENCMVIGAGGIYASAEDLCNFTYAITNKDKGILSEESIKAMAEKEYLKGVWDNDSTENIMEYGLGWDSVNMFPFNRYNQTALCKGGDSNVYHSCTIAIPESKIVMSVVSSGGSSIFNESFASTVLLKFLKDNNKIPSISPDINLKVERSQYMPKELKKYSGLYINRNGLLNIDIEDDGTLSITQLSGKDKNKIEKYYHTYSGFFMDPYGESDYKFKDEKNGCIYLECRKYTEIKDLSPIVQWDYSTQKINKQDIMDYNDKTKLKDNFYEAWKNRKNYFVLNNKYTSLDYMTNDCFRDFDPEIFGFWGGSKIYDQNLSKAYIRIPDLNGRDSYDYKFFTKDNIEYLTAGDYVYGSSDYVKTFDKNINEISIGDDGYTIWFIVPDNLNGKNLNVKCPTKGAFYIYNSEKIPEYNSYVVYSNKDNVTSEDHTYKLEAGYFIAFAGEPHENFNITITN